MNTVGLSGEHAARIYLIRKGYRWRASNFVTRWGEIDLIMEDKGVLVFIEVKKRMNRVYGEPEEAITVFKQRHIERVALAYVQKYQLFEKMMRFDVISIGPGGLKHFVNAFSGSTEYY